MICRGSSFNRAGVGDGAIAVAGRLACTVPMRHAVGRQMGIEEGTSRAGRAYRIARRVVVFVVGSTVLLIGLVLLVTPGPAFLVIPAGLGILAIEFAWARHWLHRVRDMARNGLRRVDPR